MHIYDICISFQICISTSPSASTRPREAFCLKCEATGCSLDFKDAVGYVLESKWHFEVALDLYLLGGGYPYSINIPTQPSHRFSPLPGLSAGGPKPHSGARGP